MGTGKGQEFVSSFDDGEGLKVSEDSERVGKRTDGELLLKVVSKKQGCTSTK